MSKGSVELSEGAVKVKKSRSGRVEYPNTDQNGTKRHLKY